MGKTKKELAENIFWKMENEGFEYWAANYCDPKEAPNEESQRIMKEVKKLVSKLDGLRADLIDELANFSDEIEEL